MKKGFTLTGVTIVVIILAIISIVTVPLIQNNYENSKEKIIDIANDEVMTHIYEDDVLLEEGYSVDTSKYTIIDIKYIDNEIYIYVQGEKENE